jgi:hypothetical protein
MALQSPVKELLEGNAPLVRGRIAKSDKSHFARFTDDAGLRTDANLVLGFPWR